MQLVTAKRFVLARRKYSISKVLKNYFEGLCSSQNDIYKLHIDK